MDLSASPDWDARVCYAVVLLCGLISARLQLYKRFLNLHISGIWLVPNTWLIFGIYVAIPLALFWVMDRMGAVNDTSLFAALLVGLAYPAILAGGFGGLQAPTGVASVLKPLDAVTDAIIKSVNKALNRIQQRFEDFVVGRMKTHTAIYDDLLASARSSPIDVAALDKQLNDPSGVKEKQARAIYLQLSGCPNFVESLTAKKNLMQRFEDFVVGRMKTDTAIYDDLLALARSSPIDVAALDKQLNDLKDSAKADPSGLKEKQARAIYLQLSGCPNFVESLTAKKNIMQRFEDFVVGSMKADTAIYDDLLALARSSPIDVAALDKQLNDLKDSANADPSGLKEKQARAICLQLSGCPDFVETLTANKNLMQGHRLKSPIIRSRVVVWSIIILFLVLVAGGAFFLTRPSQSVAYYGWRLGKANNSERDRFRAREKIRDYLLDPESGKETYHNLMRIVRSPGLSAERVDIILQLLLQARNEEYHKQMLCIELIDDLRVDNVDARSRVHQTLLFLATERDPQFKDHQKELDSWNPTKGDSVPTLEEWIRRWKKFFREVQQSGSVTTKL